MKSPTRRDDKSLLVVVVVFFYFLFQTYRAYRYSVELELFRMRVQFKFSQIIHSHCCYFRLQGASKRDIIHSGLEFTIWRDQPKYVVHLTPRDHNKGERRLSFSYTFSQQRKQRRTRATRKSDYCVRYKDERTLISALLYSFTESN